MSPTPTPPWKARISSAMQALGPARKAHIARRCVEDTAHAPKPGTPEFDAALKTANEVVASHLTRWKGEGVVVHEPPVWSLAEAAPVRLRAIQPNPIVAAWADDLALQPLPVDCRGLSKEQLLRLHADAVRELKTRFGFRVANIVGEHAEHLVRDALAGELCPASEASVDVLKDDKRIQVKARVVPNPRNQGFLQMGIARSWEGVTHFAIILFDSSMQPRIARLIPIDVVFEHKGRFNEHQRGYVVRATPELLFHPDSVDLMPALRQAA